MARRCGFWIAAVILLLAWRGPAASETENAGLERVAPAALEAVRAAPDGRAQVLVRWSGTNALPSLAGESRQERHRRVVAALREQAVPGIGLCRRLGRVWGDLHAQPLWIINGAIVSVDRPALLALAHQSEVRAVLAPPPLRLTQRVPGTLLTPVPGPWLLASLTAAVGPNVPWDVARLGAPDLWAQGINGQGVSVATIDTGADLTHPALQNSYRGLATGGDERNWLDLIAGRPHPYDDIGHGTQTISLAVGDGGADHPIGIAPGARWMAVKAADPSGMLDVANALRAMQWLLAPTDMAGEQPEPDRAPEIVSSSWGDYPGTDETLRDAVRAWAAAGIVPIFAAGNNGSNGMSSPASYPEAIAVGAADGRDQLVPFSSHGPSPIDGSIKPDMVAPGLLVATAVPGGGYSPSSGTSFAAPLVAGTAALLLQANPALSPADIADALRRTADPVAPPPLPNNSAGWGRVNALAAVHSVQPAGSRG